MIYVCGDTHIPLDIGKLSMKNFSEQAKMTRNDFVIILGDFGLLWRKDKTFFHWLKWLEEKHLPDLGYTFHIHSRNPVGVANMRAIIEHNGWKEIK